MSIENAKKQLSEAIYQLKLAQAQAQVGVGRGAGGREVALAVTNAEQAEHCLLAAEQAQARERATEPEDKG